MQGFASGIPEALAHPGTDPAALAVLLWLGLVTTALVLFLEAEALESLSASGEESIQTCDSRLTPADLYLLDGLGTNHQRPTTRLGFPTKRCLTFAWPGIFYIIYTAFFVAVFSSTSSYLSRYCCMYVYMYVMYHTAGFFWGGAGAELALDLLL